jgi:hypothetical protein
MSAEVTPEIVRGLWKHMTEYYGSEVVDKSNSTLMRVVASTLQLFGVEQASDFMTRFTTTVGATIYCPFIVGEPAPGWSLLDELYLCVHEHMHVYQWRTEGIGFAAKYLVSSAARAAYEAEAYRSAAELSWWQSGQLIAPTALADHLRAYGCSQADIDSAAEIIELSEDAIRQGGILNPPTAVAIAWLNSNAPQLRAAT